VSESQEFDWRKVSKKVEPLGDRIEFDIDRMVSEGYDFTEFAVFLKLHAPEWLSGGDREASRLSDVD